MQLLVIGSGGREHALIDALLRSKGVKKVYCLPGNAGIAQLAELVAIKDTDFAGITQFCKDKNIGLVIVGPEVPLVAGIADYLEKQGIKVFGPSAKAAQLEGSKGFTKQICSKYNIPTAVYGTFTDITKAENFITTQKFPLVVKADGLAAGKGVIIARNKQEANAAVDEILSGRFGQAGSSIVIEEFLVGEEVSFFAICDGKTAIAFGAAQDHKAVGEGDTGPNTGGMGTYSPAPVMTKALEKEVMETIIHPTMRAMEKEGAPFKGVLFAGLMVTKDGPKLLEYNTRFGDPETQSLMLRLKSDLLELILAACEGKLAGKKVELGDNAAMCVVMAAKGYPGDYQKGTVIKGLEEAAKLPGIKIFHAGTAKKDGAWVSNGGRVLGVAAVAVNVVEAQKLAYKAVDRIDWKEGFCRRDIGWRAINRT